MCCYRKRNEEGRMMNVLMFHSCKNMHVSEYICEELRTMPNEIIYWNHSMLIRSADLSNLSRPNKNSELSEHWHPDKSEHAYAWNRSIANNVRTDVLWIQELGFSILLLSLRFWIDSNCTLSFIFWVNDSGAEDNREKERCLFSADLTEKRLWIFDLFAHW